MASGVVEILVSGVLLTICLHLCKIKNNVLVVEYFLVCHSKIKWKYQAVFILGLLLHFRTQLSTIFMHLYFSVLFTDILIQIKAYFRYALCTFHFLSDTMNSATLGPNGERTS